jgi:Ca2+:H+ antiporter
VVAAALAATAAAGLLDAAGAAHVAVFIVAGLALAAQAGLIGQAMEQLGERLRPGATGLLQSAFGNLPELFVGLFALHRGLVDVVKAALVGSILANTLLVLGLAFVIGGLRHGPQRFASEDPRMIGTLLLLAVAALLVPTLAARLHTPAGPHVTGLSDACAVVLVVVYAASIPFWLRGGATISPNAQYPLGAPPWPAELAVAVLATASAGAAATSNWFVGALVPSIHSLHLSAGFTGLVIVAVASNAVENAVGVRFAAQGRPDYALSSILNSPLQVALLLTPALVLASRAVGPAQLSLVLAPILVAALGLAALAVIVVVYDGEYVWLEGVALIGLYAIVAAAFWWG